ncbi:MAG: DNA starvation/stationary phase protection protein [Chloroflexota bacterium]|nr:MAG: DNA starvation/stationary phase protection protein [Chloroflexota bacterium]
MTITTAFATRNDLPQTTRETIITLLNQHLADTFDLYSQTKQAHWNVKGMHFIQLHELFDALAGSVLGYVDEIAERATALGGYAKGTARMAAHNSRLSDFPETVVEGKEVVAVLAERYAQLAAFTREAIETALKYDDQDTADLMIEISRGLDKHLWFLEAHLQG